MKSIKFKFKRYRLKLGFDLCLLSYRPPVNK